MVSVLFKVKRVTLGFQNKFLSEVPFVDCSVWNSSRTYRNYYCLKAFMAELLVFLALGHQELTIYGYKTCTVEKVLNKFMDVPLYTGRSKCMVEGGIATIIIRNLI